VDIGLQKGKASLMIRLSNRDARLIFFVDAICIKIV
jgi:hypothetical protein